ncbi:Multidrug resistance protein MdtA [Fusobacterium sp. DD29]|uniref:efflux RND transporter periplasmic adaptor subunit n=1 Tax=unclassified Fusobacterium TaxID=2648384 RepID=UPI001B8BD161|nr:MULTISPECIES: efflux RND transporter periplasmic adaptor subunit [unclassified Fusobacterium]MBR8701710.1 Multidrug resistance protein MdtA [Fusobacterium sp. DD45]MBR8711504.1 Multidrug resistance protein MdtA [Fusobacterium sp. DD28]MBR8749816.1 Multidrug resistance protein MdtA [Fusobacterium sp. DD29]MBR8752053.1 Multidrug resistance protein MdtA [Fusobacterium sp. DD26]MBR8762058.1 Multidrug resistance protein MdtA [Fusobacterium sp. DD25]
MKRAKYLVFILLLMLVGCGKKQETKQIEAKVKYVVTQPVQYREMNQVFRSDAILEPHGKVDHKTEKGGTIEKILKKNGDKVNKGDLVMILKDGPTESAYFTAKANYASSKSAMEIAKNNYEKFKKLYSQQLVSYLEYVNYENNYINARGAFEAAQAKFESAKSDYDKLRRKADISGVVGNLFGKVGNKVSASDTLFTVIDDSSMESYVGFPAEWLDQIKVGLGVDITIPDIDKSFKGRIVEINPIAQADTKKFMIKIAVDNKDRAIKDGMYSYVLVPAGKTRALSIEDEAVFVRNLLSYVYKIEDGVAKRIEVKQGATNLPYTQISSPNIKEGDRVVVKGVFGLEEGDKVEENTVIK